MNVADYMTRHDTESGNDQNDANQLPRPQLSGDTEINLTEHEKLRFLEVVRALPRVADKRRGKIHIGIAIMRIFG